MAKRIRRATKSQADILFDEQMAAIKRATSDVASGVTDPATMQARIADVLGTAKGLDKARQARLALAATEAARTPQGSGSRGAIVLAGNRVVDPQLGTQSRPSEMLGERIRVPVVRVGAAPMPMDPIAQAVQAGRMEGERRAQVAQRVRAATPKIEDAVGKIRIPGYFGSAPATNIPEVQEAVTRLRASATPKQAAARGREAIRIASTKAQAGAPKATVGKGLLAGGAATLVGLMASKMLGKKDEIDPQVQLALAQQIGMAQRGGGADTSRQLMDLSRALTVVKKLQELAAVQGPAAARPRLI